MKISIIGSNGMLSTAITKAYFNKNNIVDVYGLLKPEDYDCTSFSHIDLVKNTLDVSMLADSDIIFYAAGAGVQASINTNPLLMYDLNVNAPIKITLNLKNIGYKGKFVSFGSYMEIGLNDNPSKWYSELEVINSPLKVTNDYALSKRLFGRYVNDLNTEYTYWHFILPNMFSYNDIKPGTRLIPYILKYIQEYKKGIVPEKPSFSAGTQMRQFILQEDIFTVIDKALENNITSGIYNIGGGEFMSIKSLIQRIFDFYDVPCEENYFGKEIRRDGDIGSLKIDGSKLFNAIAYLPSTKIEDIL